MCTTGGMQKGVAAVGNSPWFLRQLKIELPYDSALPLLGLCTHKRSENRDLDRCLYTHVLGRKIHMKTIQQCKDKPNITYTHTRNIALFSLQKVSSDMCYDMDEP